MRHGTITEFMRWESLMRDVPMLKGRRFVGEMVFVPFGVFSDTIE